MRENQQGSRKLVLGAALVGSFIAYSLAHNVASRATAAPSATAGAPTSSSASTSTPAPSGTSISTGTSNSAYKDGTYTGPVTDAQWGNVQVQVTISGGQISNVQFLQYPNERDYSIQVNQYADPVLIQEAIQAQSANVDLVSGATDTTDAFIQSLTDALTQAQR